LGAQLCNSSGTAFEPCVCKASGDTSDGEVFQEDTTVSDTVDLEDMAVYDCLDQATPEKEEACTECRDAAGSNEGLADQTAEVMQSRQKINRPARKFSQGGRWLPIAGLERTPPGRGPKQATRLLFPS